MLQLFTALIITNVLAAAIQLSGVMLLALAALGEDRFLIEVRQSVLLACTCTRVLCCLPAYSDTTKG
ncbi:hypothetical protein PtrV1_06490 [Pyrenophora tritici-repentis]|nr:hypothetical protein PtrV1_06490 [Pyrenophora tritici-repentis]KAI0605302.1 hypothetical protein TUN205_10456 [Pyrenophora tritici-repentis]